MKNLLCAFVFLMSCLQLQAQHISVNSGWGWKNKTIKGSRNVIQKDVSVSSKFNSITGLSAIDVYYQPAAEYSITLEGDDNIIDFIETKFNDNNLVIGLKKNTSFKNAKALKVIVTSPKLNFVQLNGSGDFYSEKTIQVNELQTQQNGSGDISIQAIDADKVTFIVRGSGDIKVQDEVTAQSISLESQGSGDIKANVTAKQINGMLKGSGDLILSGKTELAEFNLFGSGDVSASKLTAQNVVADTKGSGDVIVTVMNSLQANTFGSGDIVYNGNPSVEKNEKGSGEVYKK